MKQNANQQYSSSRQKSSMSAHISHNQNSIISIENAKAASSYNKIIIIINGEIEITIMQAQEKVQMEAKENDEIWGRIAKTIDVAFAQLCINFVFLFKRSLLHC